MEEKEKSFVIRDRRFSTDEEQPEQKPEQKKAEPQASSSVTEPESPEDGDASEECYCGEGVLPEVNFATFVVSLSSSILVHLGEIEDPQSGRKEPNLPLARHTIDILALLQEKTKGNLTVQEEQLLNNILYDLRMRYVRKKA